MFKAALFAIALAACGGKSKPAAPVEKTEVTDAPKEAPPEEAKPAEPDPSVMAAAELAEQYDAGKKIYADKECNTCHGNNGEGNAKGSPPVIGEKAFPEKPAKASKLRKGIMFKTAKDVMDFVKAKMPLKKPNTLTDDEAAAVTAWMLSETKVNITAKLDASNAASVNLR